MEFSVRIPPAKDNNFWKITRRDDMPPADGSSTCSGSTSVRGRAGSPHISVGRPVQATSAPITYRQLRHAASVL